MPSARVAFIVSLSVAIAVWIAAFGTEQQPDQPSDSAIKLGSEGERRQVDSAFSKLVVAENLFDPKKRARRVPLPLETDRNPFMLEAPSPTPENPAVTQSFENEAVTAGAVETTRTQLSLAGIAFGNPSDQDGPVGIGIFSTETGQTYLAKVGELVVSGYRVEFVGATSVTLIHETGDRLRLVLP